MPAGSAARSVSANEAGRDWPVAGVSTANDNMETLVSNR